MSALVTIPEGGRAVLSEDRRYRYMLSRVWEDSNPSRLLFIGLNPSTADEQRLDPTLRRIARFAIREGCGGMYVANLFAFRATKPKNMMAAENPVGPLNDEWLRYLAWISDVRVCGWGAHGSYRSRDREVLTLLDPFRLHRLTMTKGGQPGHPLYVRGDTPLLDYS